ncbi:hypothetical protein [Pseudoxanthomonas mexicana]
MNKKHLSALCLLTLVAAAACSRDGAPAPAPEAAPTAAVPAAEPEPLPAPIQQAKGANNLLTATPGVGTCDAGIEVNLTWDVNTTPAISEIDLLVSKDADTKLFVSGGPVGEAATGPWVYSGTTFVLRSKSDQAELDRVEIGGPACAPPVTEAPAPAPDNAQ